MAMFPIRMPVEPYRPQSATEGCRKQARQCAALAAAATDAELKHTLAGMARNWMKLALDHDRAEALFGDPLEPSKRA
jgi:5'-deoxynucleotidase YfbR-like HD superfamily hydrolase